MVQDIPKLYTALSETLSVLLFLCLYRQFLIRRRLPIRLLISMSALAVLQLFCGTVSNWLWLLGMAGAGFVMRLSLKLSLSLDMWTSLCLAARAFMYAELTAALEWEIYHFYWRQSGSVLFQHSFCLFFYLLCFSLFYFLENRILPEKMERSYLTRQRKDALITLAITLLSFALSNLSYVYVHTPFSGTDTRTTFNIRTLIDLSGVLMLYLMNLQLTDFSVRLEMEAMQNLLDNQYSQFKRSEENIALINSKYHDLKHQINLLRMETDSSMRSAYLEDLEEGLSFYGTEYKTGSRALDTILTEKGTQALQKDVTLTVMADGSLLDFLQVMDLCTVFGNALDNAIEHTEKIPDKGSRLVHLSVTGKKSFISILVENRFSGCVQLQDGLPVSTKGDARYHGYGIKSIRRTVEKYGGHMNVRISDGWFRLEILLRRSC